MSVRHRFLMFQADAIILEVTSIQFARLRHHYAEGQENAKKKKEEEERGASRPAA